MEPYRILCVADFPAKFDQDSAARLLSLAEKGVRTGVYIIMHVDEEAFARTQLREFNLEAFKSRATVVSLSDANCVAKLPNNGQIEEFRIIPDTIPDTYFDLTEEHHQDSLFNVLLDRASAQAERGAFRVSHLKG